MKLLLMVALTLLTARAYGNDDAKPLIPPMQVDVQIGFNTRVVIRIDKEVIFDQFCPLDNLIGRTGSARAAARGKKLIVEVPALALRKTFPLDYAKGRYFGLSLANRRIVIKQQREPFEYE